VKWNVDLHDDLVPEYHVLHRAVQDELLAHIAWLEQFGPQLGRLASIPSTAHVTLISAALCEAQKQKQ
jgi:hypothetical protein